ncbi:hypothetical protein TBS_05430 [Thermobispora bispora]
MTKGGSGAQSRDGSGSRNRDGSGSQGYGSARRIRSPRDRGPVLRDGRSPEGGAAPRDRLRSETFRVRRFSRWGRGTGRGPGERG